MREDLSGRGEAGLLVRLRMRYFEQEVRQLLARNLHLAVVLLGLAGLPLAYNPEIVGLPLLDLARPALTVGERLAGEAIFFGVLLGWVTLMRSAARGGEMARYLTSLPLRRGTLEQTERVMAALAAGLAWVPVGVAALTAGVVARDGGSPAVSLILTGTMGLTTLAISRAWLADRGTGRMLLLLASAGTLALADGRRLLAGSTAGPVLLTVAVALFVLHRPATAGPAPTGPAAAGSGEGAFGLKGGLRRLCGVPLRAMGRSRIWVAHSVQGRTLFQALPASTVGRLLLASLFAWAAAWQTVHNLQADAGVLVRHVLLGACLFVLAGLHRPLLDARAPHVRYLRSFPLALRTLRGADRRAVWALSLGVVLAGLWLGGGAAGRGHPARLLLEAVYYAGLTGLVGSQWVLERPETALWSVGVTVAATVLGYGLFS